MVTGSRTYNWAPPLADLIIAAYGRCQIRRTAITIDHLQDAAFACNLLQVEWANEQVNLWTVELATTPLIAGQHTYDVDPTTLMIMAAYISTGEMYVRVDTTNISVDELTPTAVDVTAPTADTVTFPERAHRIITSVDRDTFASFPDKHKRGKPSVYWFNQQIKPTITLWEVPDGHQRYVLHYYRARQMQDAVMGQDPITGDPVPANVPYQFLEAYVATLAFKLAEIYVPARMEELAARAKLTFTQAAERDVENSPLRIVPSLSSYTTSVY